MNTLQAVLLGLLQGVTELFPVSSLGHLVLLPTLAGWRIDQAAPSFLPFAVMLHLGTAAALLAFYWRTWVEVVRGFFRSLGRRSLGRPETDPAARLAWLVVVGVVPTGLLGLLLEKPVARLFASPRLAALFLLLNGGVLALGELLYARRPGRARGADGGLSGGALRPVGPRAAEAGDRPALSQGAGALSTRLPDAEMAIDRLGLREALWVGVTQALALLPGFSREGVTMTAGLGAGLSRLTAATYSYLLSAPLILAAGLLEVPKLLRVHGALGTAVLGGLVAGVAAYASVRWLSRYFRTGTLWPFAVYSAAAGLVSLLLLVLRG
ncbi:MAG: undecaprenyl-diphosphate phosphatase [Bacillota bacterium]|nr:undecaprenyl-diphosphate phosphatase [Bacillota bacterium]